MYNILALLKDMEINNFTYMMGAFIISVVLFIAMMIYYKVRLVKLEQYVDYLKVQSKTAGDVSTIAKKIEEDIQKQEPRRSGFEDEQEHVAVISYQELLKKDRAALQNDIKPKYSDIEYSNPSTKPKYSDVEYTRSNVASLYSDDNYKKPKAEPQDYLKKEVREQLEAVSGTEFLSTLVNLRSNLK